MEIIHDPNWALTQKNNSIEIYYSAAPDRLHRPILLMGGIHGDEPEGVHLATSALEWLKSDSSSEQSVKTPWVLIPCLNIDGFLHGTRCNGNGVDLNRNYPSKSWSKEYTEEKYFPGPHPGSEIEIQAVIRLIAQFNPRLIIHCHSWKPCIVCTGHLGQTDGEYLSQSSGYELINSIGYPTPGSLSQYGWFDCGIPVICTEEAEQTSKEQTWTNFSEGIKNIFRDPSPRK